MEPLSNSPDEKLHLTRRSLLAVLGASAAAVALAACDNNKGVKGIVDPLPDAPHNPYAPTYQGPDTGYAPTTPPIYKNPPVSKPPANPWGIIPRSYWAHGGPNMKTIDPMDGVALITFHHSGDPKVFTSTDFTETAQHLEWVREYHVSRRFQDIGYHFAIDPAGRVWQLRSLKYQGQHVRYNNEHNIGVVVLGNFDKQAPTVAQKDRIKSFANLLRKQYGLAANRVKTHREIVSTECPGDSLQPYMVQIRKQGLV